MSGTERSTSPSVPEFLELTPLPDARKDAAAVREELDQLLTKSIPKYTSEDTSLVVFGSLARGEWTSASDLDWTYLIDGQANSDHLVIAQRIRKILKEHEERFRQPGPTGTFGNMAFSHDIIHQIGGQNDSNKNTTQRILLLLESVAIGKNSQAYERVIKGVINRYLEEDNHLLIEDRTRYRVPRFLLNDIVRFWRTMAVDFASKQRDRAGDPDDTKSNLVNYIRQQTKLTPLEVVAAAIENYAVSKSVGDELFGAYTEFLKLVDDMTSRQALEKLRATDSRTDTTFRRIREISQAFEHALDLLFFENSQLAPLTRKYGVF